MMMARCDGYSSTTTTAVGGSGRLRRGSRMAGLERHFGTTGLSVTDATTDATATASRRSHRW